MCGFRCDLCKAFAPNIQKKDERKQLSEMWKKYFDLDFTVEKLYCDGCTNDPNARIITTDCPVKKCVTEKALEHCGDCKEYPCETFMQQKGKCFEEMKTKLGERFSADEYLEYCSAYDNKTRLDEYRKNKQ